MKAIYNPKGAAAEYSKWACNLYNSCSARCTYCYCKSILRGIWTDKPVLKKSLVDEETAFQIFCKEVDKNLPELQKHGLFFNFVSDPFLHETIKLNSKAITRCVYKGIPVKALTKQTWWTSSHWLNEIIKPGARIAIGFTLTGHDNLEPGANTNKERINAMKFLHAIGVTTFASVEPIITLKDSLEMIWAVQGYCNLYKIGLKSGSHHSESDLEVFVDAIISGNPYAKIYFKDSLLEQAGILRQYLNSPNCVSRNYNIFTGTDEGDELFQLDARNPGF
jgi:hypothetical protein